MAPLVVAGATRGPWLALQIQNELELQSMAWGGSMTGTAGWRAVKSSSWPTGEARRRARRGEGLHLVVELHLTVKI
jgi:hypothetical protein